MWLEPKTNWVSTDRFNASDYNRILNNIIHLREVAIKMYDNFTLNNMSGNKTARDYLYADDINAIENALNTINVKTIKQNYGNYPTYADNGKVIDYKELNRIESALLDLYVKLNNQANGRRMFTFNFGTKGGL